MLKDLRANGSKGVPWNKEAIRGHCANKGCMKVGTKECSVCGLRYCCSECQKLDWKSRHKHFCKPKDIPQTELCFMLLNVYFEDYKSGKSSIDRYWSVASLKTFNDLQMIDQPGPCLWCNLNSNSGRILAALDDTEKEKVLHHPKQAIIRSLKLYLVNPLIPSRLYATGDLVELVPLNQHMQSRYFEQQIFLVPKEMRKLKLRDSTAFHIISISIARGYGMLYGNPILLSLESVIAYKDFFDKFFDGMFPFAIFCSLFPDFRVSMLTGDPGDDNKVVGEDGEFIEKSRVSDEMRERYVELLDEGRMKRETEEEDVAFNRSKCDSDEVSYHNWIVYQQKYYWWRWKEFDIKVDCSESLALLPLEESANVRAEVEELLYGVIARIEDATEALTDKTCEA